MADDINRTTSGLANHPFGSVMDDQVLFPQSIAYEHLRPDLQTGDVVLFHGLDLESALIEVVEHSPWSHVGMVVRLSCIDYPLLWESTPLHFLTDPLLHRPKSGPRLVSLDERLRLSIDQRLYNRFIVRHLRVPRSVSMLNALTAFIAEVHRLSFPGNWEMLKDFLEGRLLNSRPETRRSFYCAELVAESYMRMRLLPASPPSNAYLPKDFTPEGRLALQRDASLSPVIAIHY